MNQRKFFINITIRIIILSFFCISLSLVYTFINEEYYFTLIGIVLLILFQIYLLVRYVSGLNKSLLLFITSLKFEDSNVRFSENLDKSVFNKLHQSFDHINTMLQELKVEKEKQHLYLENIVNYIGVGLISYDDDFKVEIINNAAKNILQITRLADIDSLDTIHENFATTIKELQPGKPELLKISVNKEFVLLSLNINAFKLEEKLIRIVSLQNITNEIETKELESWQKLIRVLTHEIMNSVSPLTSLTTTISRYFKKTDEPGNKTVNEIDNDVINNTVAGLETIEDTNKNLLDFVQGYRSLTSLSLGEPKSFEISRLFKNVQLLFEKGLNSENIELKAKVHPENLEVWADENQIQQVVINLINNSIDALKNVNSPKIKIEAYKNSTERTVIEIIDNGKGIEKDLLENIFIPFYSTKVEGSGIGLSLSKQIINQHRGAIIVSSEPFVETKFSLLL